MTIREAFWGEFNRSGRWFGYRGKTRLVRSMEIGELERQMKYKIQVDETIGTLYSIKFQVFG